MEYVSHLHAVTGSIVSPKGHVKALTAGPPERGLMWKQGLGPVCPCGLPSPRSRPPRAPLRLRPGPEAFTPQAHTQPLCAQGLASRKCP